MCPQDCPTHGLGFPSHFAIPEEMKYSRAVASDGRYSARLTCDFHEDAGDGSRTCRKKWDCSNPQKGEYQNDILLNLWFNSTICVSSFWWLLYSLTIWARHLTIQCLFQVEALQITNRWRWRVWKKKLTQAYPSAQNHFPAHFNTIHMVYRCIVYIYTQGWMGIGANYPQKRSGISYRIIYSLPMFLHSWIPKAPVTKYRSARA